MVVKDEARDFEAIPTGVQPGVCSAIHDLGMQEGYGGKPTHQVVLVWELEERRTEGEFSGQRFIVTKKYTASLNERANLNKDLESWRGKSFTPEERAGFELDVLLNVNCNLNMVEKTSGSGKTFVNVASITGLHKGQKKMKPEQPGYTPNWILGLINGDDGIPSPDDFDDSIPF